MARLSRLHLAAATAIPIVVVLISLGLVAFRGRATGPAEPPPSDPGQAEPAPGPEEGGPRLAVTPERFDAMGKLLDDLGEGYLHETIDEEAIRDPKASRKYGAIFLTCAEGGAEDPELGKGLREFVSGGGTLYASDLRYDAVAAAFPEFVNPASVAQGVHQDLRATVASPELRAVVGAEVPLHFELDGWRPAAFRGSEVAVLVRGKLRTTAGVTIEAPLLVKFPFGRGTVLFTSFHDQEKNSPAEIKLLNYLALRTVLAGLESRELDAMSGDGLAAQATTAIGVDPAAGPRKFRYDLAKAGPIQFRLGFEGTSALMRLEVVSPTGKRTVKRGESSVAIDILDASPGRWEYQLVAEEVPFPGFPTLLIVGAADRSGGSGSGSVNPPMTVTGGNVRFEEISLGNKRRVTSRMPRIAVSDPPRNDDMGKLLVKLGRGFRYKRVTLDDLLRSDALDEFDIFFLTCNDWPSRWARIIGGNELRQGVIYARLEDEKMKRVGDTIRRFVERGGTLYASCIRFEVVIEAFPERNYPVRLNERVLPKLSEVERKWLDLMAPSGHVNTVYDSLQKADLSPALKAKLGLLVASVELSDLVKGDLNERGARPTDMVRKVLKKYAIPSTEADVSRIAKVMCDWEEKIHDKIRHGANAKMKALMAQTEKDLQWQRDRIIQRDEEVRDGQKVEAHVVDTGLREMLGTPRLGLDFNDTAFYPARFRGDVTVLLRGEFQTVHDTRFEVPLLEKFREGQGTVIFTSFHNAKQNNEQEDAVLRYLVFTAVTAREEANAAETMLKGGFSPAKQNQINHMAGNASITRTYTSTGPGPLRFALVFTGADARLRLTLVAPGGQRYSNEVESTIVVEATGAPAGEWSYSVEAVKVPYENFPFGVSIGKGETPARRR